MHAVSRRPYELRTERLSVRCYAPGDAPALSEAVAAGHEHLLPWLPWAADEPLSPGQRTQLLRQFRGKFDLDRDHIYGAFERSGERLVGGTGLHPRIEESGREIGYWLRLDAVGQGLASEMVAAMVHAGLRFGEQARLEVRCADGNARSRGVAERLGFRYVGALRAAAPLHGAAPVDMHVYDMLREELPASAAARYEVRGFDALGLELV